jgi:hypothetical protein
MDVNLETTIPTRATVERLNAQQALIERRRQKCRISRRYFLA